MPSWEYCCNCLLGVVNAQTTPRNGKAPISAHGMAGIGALCVVETSTTHAAPILMEHRLFMGRQLAVMVSVAYCAALCVRLFTVHDHQPGAHQNLQHQEWDRVRRQRYLAWVDAGFQPPHRPRPRQGSRLQAAW